MEWIKAACSNDGSPSSARIINLMGAIIASMVILIRPLDAATFTTYLAYCAGTYGIGKYFDTKATNATL